MESRHQKVDHKMPNKSFTSTLMQEARQKIIDIETAVQMLGLVMEDNAHLQPFVEFLQVQTDYKTINLDQWQGFCRFVEEVGFHPLTILECHRN